MQKEEWKLEFNNTGIERSIKIIDPLDNKSKYSQPEHIEYNEWIEKFETNKINVVVTKMERKIETDILKSLVFYGFFQPSEAQEEKITTKNINSQNEVKIQNEPNNHVLIFDNKEHIVWNLKNDILKNTVKWLYNKGKLQVKDLPIYAPGGSRYLLNTKPNHADGRSFIGKPYEILPGMFLLLNFSGSDCIRISEYLMKRFAPEINFKIVE